MEEEDESSEDAVELDDSTAVAGVENVDRTRCCGRLDDIRSL